MTVDSLLSAPSTGSVPRAQSLVEELEISYGFSNRMAVQLMKLNILLSDQSVDEEKLKGTMSRVLRSAVLTTHNFKM